MRVKMRFAGKINDDASLSFLSLLINTGLQPGVGGAEVAKAVSTAWPRGPHAGENG